MSKGLEALKSIKAVLNIPYNKDTKEVMIPSLDIIEKELKRLEKIDDWKFANGIKEDDSLLKCAYKGVFFIDYVNYEGEKRLQAFIIIKEKRVDTNLLRKTKKCSKYNLGVDIEQRLEEGEYRLLKELL